MANRLCLSREGQLERENLEVQEIMMRGVKLKCGKILRRDNDRVSYRPDKGRGPAEGAQKGRPVARRGPGIINMGQDAQPGSPG